MKFKILSAALIILSLFSCNKSKNIEGIYYVNEDKTDKVYIEKIEKGLYKVYTPGTWEEIAVYKKGNLSGEWEYPEDYYNKKEAGLKGKHEAEFKKEEGKFYVNLYSPEGEEWGSVTWTKFPDIKIKDDDSGEKTIYLTFDDGPFDGTPNVLLALEETGVGATFFILGKHASELREKHSNTLKALKGNSNILLANHSYSHANGKYKKYYSDTDKVIKDLSKNEEKILQYESFWDKLFKRNIESKIVRLPGRNAWIIDDYEFYDIPDVKKIKEALIDNEYRVFGWDVEWRMSKGKPSEKIESVIRKIDHKFLNHKTKFKNKCIILMHDRMFYNKENRLQLIELINNLKESGYKFDLIDNF